jgi:hypothetical protein
VLSRHEQSVGSYFWTFACQRESPIFELGNASIRESKVTLARVHFLGPCQCKIGCKRNDACSWHWRVTEVAIAYRQPGVSGFRRVLAKKVAELLVGQAREVSRRISFLVLRANQNSGSAQFVGHDLKTGEGEALSRQLHGSSVGGWHLHGEQVAVIQRPCFKRQLDLFQVVRAVDSAAGVPVAQGGQQDGRYDHER